MRCPSCGSLDTTVVDTRRKVIEEKNYTDNPKEDGKTLIVDTVYRRHRCKFCNFRYTTYEVYAKDELRMIENNERYEQKLTIPIVKYKRMVKNEV